MKLLTLLLLLSFSIAAQERVPVRIMNAQRLELKKLNSNHCTDYGKFEDKCREDFDNRVLKDIKNLNKGLVDDSRREVKKRIMAEIKEEKELKKYKALLDAAGVTYTPAEDSDSLKAKYSNYQEEQRELYCVTNLKTRIDSFCVQEISYDVTDTCASLETKIFENGGCDPEPIGSGSGSGN